MNFLQLPRHRLIILLLVGITMCSFYPTITAELLAVDDAEMYGWLQKHAEFDLVGIFLPGGTQGGYYRPVIAISFLIDRAFHGASLPLMHFENILIHVVNTLLVFIISCRFIRLGRDESSLFSPFLAALLFGLHPLATESVAWLSGRTDPLSILFILLSSFFLLKYRDGRAKWHLIAGIFLALSGILTKESVLAFIPAAFLVTRGETICAGRENVWRFSLIEFLLFLAAAVISVIFTFNVFLPFIAAFLYLLTLLFRHRRDGSLVGTHWALVRSAVWGGCVLLVLPSIFFILVRRMAFASDTSKISETLRVMMDDPNYTFMTFLGAAGFYAKKALVPVPLNFAIREVDPLYQFVGIVLMMLCIFLFVRRSLLDRFILAGFIMLLPSFLISFGTIAWTAYAERYVYPALPFWCVAFALGMRDARIPKTRLWLPATLAVIFAIITFDRSLTWRTNLALFKDTVEKTPQFRVLRETYMSVLMNSGDYAGAREQYEAGSKIVTVGYDPELDIRLAELLRREGKREESWKMQEKIIEKTRGERVDIIERYLGQLRDALNSATSESERKRYLCKMIVCRELLYNATTDPVHLYHAGKLAFMSDDRKSASRFFFRASEVFRPDDPYRDISRRFAHRVLAG